MKFQNNNNNHFSFCDYICSGLCKRKNAVLKSKKILYEQMKEYVQCRLEVFHFLKLSLDFEKLKYLILDENQLKIFKMLPMINTFDCNNSTDVNIKSREDKDFIMNNHREISQVEFNNTYMKILEDPDDKLNRKIMKMLKINNT